MTHDPAPLSLPASDWEGWLTSRCDGLLDEVRRVTGELTAGTPRSGAATLARWNDLKLALHNAFSTSSLIANVHPDEAVRTRAEKVEQDASALDTEIGLDRGLYDVLSAIDPGELDQDGRRVLELSLRDFRRAGVDRDEPVRARLREIAERETTVGQEFARNIRDGVRAVRVSPDVLDGLPADFVASHPAGDDGLVEVTTAYPDYVPFVTFCRDREARAALVHEFLNRAYPENDAVLHDLLALRHEHAGLLGYDGWPSYDAEVKMIGTGARRRSGSPPAISLTAKIFLARVFEVFAGSVARAIVTLTPAVVFAGMARTDDPMGRRVRRQQIDVISHDTHSAGDGEHRHDYWLPSLYSARYVIRRAHQSDAFESMHV